MNIQHDFPPFVHDFPLAYIHEGAPLGNAYLGLCVWGKDKTLNITPGCADLWDHRGGMPWTEKQNYKDIRAALEAYDTERIAQIFRLQTAGIPGQPANPTILPVGRIELTLKKTLKDVELIMEHGLVKVRCKDTDETICVRIDLKNKGLFAFTASDDLVESVRVIPSYDLTEILKNISFPEPERHELGFLQKLPVDPGYSLSVRKDGNVYSGKFQRGETFAPAEAVDWEQLTEKNTAYWRDFWSKVPAVKCDNETLNELYYSGLFRFQSMTMPDGIPAGLQGPWIEDDATPPWSADYHFNINVEMCYWPAFRSGLCENLKPVFNLLKSWKERMRETEKFFAGIEDGYMLPHAVDDRCTVLGGWWSGAIDNASSAWMAQMMVEAYDYTGDESYLRDFTFDFMKGIMRAFVVMLEKTDDGKFILPISVSPEYNAAEINAWGANSSFQLSAIHRLALDLIRVAGILKEEEDPIWRKLLTDLPELTLSEKNPGTIALWKGQDLDISHRHHSHFAILCPFGLYAAEDDKWRDVFYGSYRHWIWTGTGLWSGWSMPWAAMLHSRFRNGAMAELALDILDRSFRNKGGGTRHDANFPGYSGLHFSPRDIMQMDAYMGGVAAIQDMFVYANSGRLYFMSGCPQRWKNIDVKGLYCAGGLRADILKKDGVATLTLTAERDSDGEIELHLPQKTYSSFSEGGYEEKIVRKAFAKGEQLTITLTD